MFRRLPLRALFVAPRLLLIPALAIALASSVVAQAPVPPDKEENPLLKPTKPEPKPQPVVQPSPQDNVPVAPRDDEPHLTPPANPQVTNPTKPEPKPERQPRPNLPAFPGEHIFNDVPPFFTGVKVDHANGAYKEGDKLVVEFKAEREAFLYLLYHQADGSSLLLFPNEAQPENKVEAKQAVVIPPPPTPDSKATPFRFRVSAPFGTEVLQVVASTKPIDELNGLVKKTGRAAPVAKELIDGLQKRLAGDLTTWTEHRVQIKTTAKEAETPARKAQRFGLFFGVNRDASEPDKVKDAEFKLGAEAMRDAMLKRGGIPSENHRFFSDENATRANFEEAVTKWLPSVSQPGDTVFIFYSGHGGSFPNLDGTEIDGRDEYITTYDTPRIPEEIKTIEERVAFLRKHRIYDDTLARWIQELNGRQVVMIFETCHGGGLIDNRGQASAFTDEGERVRDLSQLNLIVVLGCAPEESVYFKRGQLALMARTFSTAAVEADGPITVKQVYEKYTQAVSEYALDVFRGPNGGAQATTYFDTILLPIILAQ